jgi:hypothetical protein
MRRVERMDRTYLVTKMVSWGVLAIIVEFGVSYRLPAPRG